MIICNMKRLVLEKLTGGYIINIYRICDLCGFTVSLPDNEEIDIHIQTFFRIVKNGNVIVASPDMFRPSDDCDEDSFEWDIPGNSLYDASIATNLEIIKRSKIVDVKAFKKDFFIYLENGISLEFYSDTVELGEEKLRVFSSEEEFVIES